MSNGGAVEGNQRDTRNGDNHGGFGDVYGRADQTSFGSEYIEATIDAFVCGVSGDGYVGEVFVVGAEGCANSWEEASGVCENTSNIWV